MSFSKASRPAWELRVLEALVNLVRLEGADISMDGGYTAENHAPAIRAASRDWTEQRIVPLLVALIDRDRLKAKAALSRCSAPSAFQDDVPCDIPGSAVFGDPDPQVAAYTLMAELVRINRDPGLSASAKEDEVKSVRAELVAACEEMGTAEYRLGWLRREIEEASTGSESEHIREWVKELRENPEQAEALREEIVALDEEDIKDIQRLKAQGGGLIV